MRSNQVLWAHDEMFASRAGDALPLFIEDLPVLIQDQFEERQDECVLDPSWNQGLPV